MGQAYSNKNKECYRTIAHLIDKHCDETCIESHRKQPVFLESFSTLLKDKHLPSSKTYKDDDHVHVSDVMYKSYRVIRKRNYTESEAILEYQIGRLLNDIKGEIDNFCYTFYTDHPEREFYIEYMEGLTLKDFLIEYKDKLTEYDILLIYFQIYLALFIAFTRFGFVHNDLHHLNIIIRDLGSEQTITYPVRIWNQTYRVRTRYFPTIIDYGLSQVYDFNKDNIKITTGYERYGLSKKYCIPVRDIYKSAFSSSSVIYDFFYKNHRLFSDIMDLASQFDYCIIPSIKSPSWGKSKVNKKSFYYLTYTELINLFHLHIQEYVSISEISIFDFAYRIPTFLNKKYVYREAYLSIFFKDKSERDTSLESKKEDIEIKGFLNESDSLRESYLLAKKLKTLLNKGKYLTFNDLNTILNLQEKVSMIRFHHRDEINFIFLELRPLIEHIEVMMIQV